MKHIIYNNIQTKKEHRKRINANFRANITIKELYICRDNASSATYMREIILLLIYWMFVVRVVAVGSVGVVVIRCEFHFID